MSSIGTSAFDTTLQNLGIGRTASGTAVTTKAEAETLDQAAFLKLMTAQLKNQDPFKPVENEAMVAQMAQFSSVAGISEMNSTLKAMADRLAGTTTADALSFVGKTVLTDGNVAFARSSGGIEAGFELAGDADQVNVAIVDANGAVLRRVQLGETQEGTHFLDWDGTTDAGEAAGDGPFTINVVATKAGKQVDAQTLVWAPVTSVSLPAGGDPVLTVAGLGARSPSSVRQVG